MNLTVYLLFDILLMIISFGIKYSYSIPKALNVP